MINRNTVIRNVISATVFACFSFVSFGSLAAQSNPDDIAGYYYYFEPKEKEYSQVEVYKSGDKYKGKVVWLKEPYQPDGSPKVDIFNKDKSKRDRPIIGISIFDGLTYNKDKKRWEGVIYDPANGDSFNCAAWFESKNVLKIKGFVGPEWMGINRTIVWNKEAQMRQ